jgi:hypothetical protein
MIDKHHVSEFPIALRFPFLLLQMRAVLIQFVDYSAFDFLVDNATVRYSYSRMEAFILRTHSLPLSSIFRKINFIFTRNAIAMKKPNIGLRYFYVLTNLSEMKCSYACMRMQRMINAIRISRGERASFIPLFVLKMQWPLLYLDILSAKERADE